MPKERAQVELEPPSELERELQEIRIVSFAGTLVEATPTPDGWIVRFEEDASNLTMDGLLEQAHTFFRDLARTGVDVAGTSYEARTGALKDVWGKELENVPVFRIELAKDVFERVNWQGFDPENFSRIANDYWLHEIVLAKEQRKQGQQQAGGDGGSSGSSN